MNAAKKIEKNTNLLTQTKELVHKRKWLPRIFKNWFRNDEAIDTQILKVLANQNDLQRDGLRTEETLRKNQSRLDKVFSENTDLRGELDKIRSENTDLRGELAQMQGELVRTQSAFTRIHEAFPWLNKESGRHEIFYFMHIPKTAGISVGNYLKEAFTPEAVMPIIFLRELGQMTRAEQLKYRLVTGHMFGLPDPYLGMKTRKITFLRDPFERAVSNILHSQRFENSVTYEAMKNQSVEDILQNPAFFWLHCNYQARYIATLAFSEYSLVSRFPEGHQHPYHVMERIIHEIFSGQNLYTIAVDLLDQFDFVGLTEHMALSLKGIAEAWKLPYPKAEYTDNVNPEKTDYRSLVSDKAYSEFCARNETDFRLYDFVKRKLIVHQPSFQTSTT